MVDQYQQCGLLARGFVARALWSWLRICHPHAYPSLRHSLPFSAFIDDQALQNLRAIFILPALGSVSSHRFLPFLSVDALFSRHDQGPLSFTVVGQYARGKIASSLRAISRRQLRRFLVDI